MNGRSRERKCDEFLCICMNIVDMFYTKNIKYYLDATTHIINAQIQLTCVTCLQVLLQRTEDTWVNSLMLPSDLAYEFCKENWVKSNIIQNDNYT